ncbi:uncharacterized protein LOC144701147 [Wolffia australiana]
MTAAAGALFRHGGPARTLSVALKSCRSMLVDGASASPSSRSFSEISSKTRRISRSIIRLPAELSCLESMLPLHSAIASARLQSVLSAESQSWGLIPQGLSMPL